MTEAYSASHTQGRETRQAAGEEGGGGGGGGGGLVGTKSSLNCRSATQMIASQLQKYVTNNYHDYVFLPHI